MAADSGAHSDDTYDGLLVLTFVGEQAELVYDTLIDREPVELITSYRRNRNTIELAQLCGIKLPGSFHQPSSYLFSQCSSSAPLDSQWGLLLTEAW